MTNLYTALIVAFVTAAVTGCQKSVPYLREEGSALDGAWRLAALECAGGSLTAEGRQYNEDIEAGIHAVLSRVEGEDVVTHIFNYDASGRTLKRCEFTLHERWSPAGDGKLTFSGTHGTVANVGGFDESDCPRKFEHREERTHEFAVTRNELRVTATKPASLQEGLPGLCNDGRTVFTYRRVL